MSDFIKRLIMAWKVAKATKGQTVFCPNGKDCESCKRYFNQAIIHHKFVGDKLKRHIDEEITGSRGPYWE